MNPDFIPESKVEVYLKLGRSLAIVVGPGTYFESATFDWIEIKQENNLRCARLVRTFHEGNEFVNAVSSFGTVNELDGEEESFAGTFSECCSWIRNKTGFTELHFLRPEMLNAAYAKLCSENAFGDDE